MTSQQIDVKWSRDGEFFNFDSLGELLDCYDDLQPGDVVEFGEAREPAISEVLNAGQIIDSMGDAAYEVLGEVAEDYPPTITPEAEAELQAALDAWATKYAPLRYWTIPKAQKYTITAEDLQP